MVVMNTAAYESVIMRKRVRRYAKYGAISTGVGGATMVLFPMLVGGLAGAIMQLKAGSFLTQNWERVPVPIDNLFYIWNIDNPKEFARGAKAKLSERGPYAYDMRIWKEEVKWAPDGKTVQYYNRGSWEFNPDKTSGSIDDKVTVINLPVAAMLGVVRSLVRRIPFISGLMEPLVMGSLNIVRLSYGMGGLTHEITVRELLEGKHFSPAVTIEFISKPLKWFGIQMPDTHMPGNKFGLLNAVKESREGPHVCETGVGDSTFLKFVTFQGRTSYNMYDDPKCTVVNASDGRQLGPYKLTKDTVIWVPIGDLCRNFYIAYKEHSSVWGIPTWRYTLPPSMFASPKKNPANTCYCQTPDDPDMCDGIYEIGPCVYNLGIPISLSYPHFLYASDKIRTMVDGMYPDVDLHETQIDFEPTAGAPLRVRAGVQVNVKLEPSAYVVGFGDIREAVLPYVWVKIVDPLNDLARLIASVGIWPLLAIDYGSVALFLGGIGGLGYTSVYAFNRRDKLRSPKPHEEAVTTTGALMSHANGVNNQTIATDTKDRNAYGLADNPPIYTISQRDYIERVGRAHYGTQTTPPPPLNGQGVNGTNTKQKYATSPPGTPEYAS